MKALVTGSRAYGTPKWESDIDLVILATPRQTPMFVQTADYSREKNGGGYSLRYGKLNLIVETNPEKFAIWERGTARLLNEAPVTRERAKEVFREEGLHDFGNQYGGSSS